MKQILLNEVKLIIVAIVNTRKNVKMLTIKIQC